MARRGRGAAPAGAAARPAHRTKTGEALVGLYAKEKETEIKRTIINALFVQNNAESLVAIARKETDPAAKRELVSKLSVMKNKVATDYLLELLNK